VGQELLTLQEHLSSQETQMSVPYQTKINITVFSLKKGKNR
jgi:hypothetical protein